MRMNAYSRSLSAFSASTARRGRGSASVTTLKQGKAQVLPDCFLFVAGLIIFQYSKAIEEADRRIISSRGPAVGFSRSGILLDSSKYVQRLLNKFDFL